MTCTKIARGTRAAVMRLYFLFKEPLTISIDVIIRIA